MNINSFESLKLTSILVFFKIERFHVSKTHTCTENILVQLLDQVITKQEGFKTKLNLLIFLLNASIRGEFWKTRVSE